MGTVSETPLVETLNSGWPAAQTRLRCDGNLKSLMDKPKRLGYISTMPTVLKVDGFEFMIHSDDHRPKHVHIRKAGEEAIIHLGENERRPSIRENINMSKSNLRRALALVFEHQDYLISEWREIHGY